MIITKEDGDSFSLHCVPAAAQTVTAFCVRSAALQGLDCAKEYYIARHYYAYHAGHHFFEDFDGDIWRVTLCAHVKLSGLH